MEEALKVVVLEELPSPEEFESQIESRNVPAVFRGCTKDWKAFTKWNPTNGGLDYLQELVGSAVVEAMLSRHAPVFYGDLRSHEMVPFPFSRFIASCKQVLRNSDGGSGIYVGSNSPGPTNSVDGASLTPMDSQYQVYLAQVPIVNLENKDKSQLQSLREDIQMPSVLEKKALASINLWMNNAKSRSSSHYDPHHNLLCIISGCKQVVLWSPSAIPLLYPMPAYGEASNHSSVDLVNPDYSIHSRAKHLSEYSQKVTLHAGDALFIPEGWFHQVDSDDLTIAVNYWWQSSIMARMSEHMDAYYLRRILRRLVNSEMNHMLGGASVYIEKHEMQLDKDARELTIRHIPDDQSETYDVKVANQKQKIALDQLRPPALQALHELVSLVHDSVNVVNPSQPVPSTSIDNSSVSPATEGKETVSVNSFCLDDDPVARLFWTLPPFELQNVLLAMVHNFPRTLETLILHVLSPVGAEVLTRKFEQMDKQIMEDERNEFYNTFYGVFDDQFAAMDSILNGKESFAHQAFRNVLDKYLGVKFDGLKL